MGGTIAGGKNPRLDIVKGIVEIGFRETISMTEDVLLNASQSNASSWPDIIFIRRKACLNRKVTGKGLTDPDTVWV